MVAKAKRWVPIRPDFFGVLLGFPQYNCSANSSFVVLCRVSVMRFTPLIYGAGAGVSVCCECALPPEFNWVSPHYLILAVSQLSHVSYFETCAAIRVGVNS